ncbi:MAG: DinB family protein [Calditrichaeota bacterium]|nr:MAG: DinB family protein [Calditrichota bacterium]
MQKLNLPKPTHNDCSEYFFTYINKVPEGNVLELFRSQVSDFKEELGKLTEEQSRFRYAEGKWSIREVLGHIIDTERIFASRSLHFARNEKQPLVAFDQDAYMKNVNFHERNLAELLAELEAVRNSITLLFESYTEKMWQNVGHTTETKFANFSIPYILVGHLIHHLAVIREKYFTKF